MCRIGTGSLVNKGRGAYEPMSNWQWKLRRLMAMQPNEVAVRVWRMVRDRAISAGRLRPYPLDVEACFASAWQENASAVYQRFLQRFPCSRDPHAHWRDLVRSAYPDCAQAILHEAERILSGSLRLFTFDVHTDIPPNWFRNYLQGDEWQAVPAHQIDYRRGDIAGGVRYCWELNRHGYFLTLAQAWLLTKNERFAQRLQQDWLDWIARNPPRFGINWTSMLECALRLHTWCWSLWLLAECPLLDERTLRPILASLWQQCAEIAMNLSIGSSANNHLIGETAGMWLFANLFPTARFASRWARTSRAILQREVLRQITPDGVTVEQAVHYQVFVMEMALHADSLARHLGKPFNEQYARRLQASARFLQAITDCAGNIPHIGDSDDAEVLPFCPHRSHAEADITEAVRVLYEHTAPRTLKATWLTAKPVPPEKPSPPIKPHHSQLFAQGGYAVMRDEEGKRVTVMDCGALGWGSIAAHAHADALAITLSVDGQPVLVDAGTYCYHDEPVWRNAFRSTRYHNTVCVDNTDQSEMLGAFLWGARAKVRIRQWYTSDLCDLLCASHDGYRRRGCGEHLRWLLWLKPDVWLVVDEVERSEGHDVVQNWLFSQACAPQMQGDRMQIPCAGITLWIQPVSAVRVHQAYGAEASQGGWVSTAFGRKEPARHLFFQRAGSGGRLATVLARGAQPPELQEWRDEAESWQVQITHQGRFWLVGTAGATRTWDLPGTTVEARTLVATWQTEPLVTHYEVID